MDVTFSIVSRCPYMALCCPEEAACPAGGRVSSVEHDHAYLGPLNGIPCSYALEYTVLHTLIRGVVSVTKAVVGWSTNFAQCIFYRAYVSRVLFSTSVPVLRCDMGKGRLLPSPVTELASRIAKGYDRTETWFLWSFK